MKKHIRQINGGVVLKNLLACLLCVTLIIIPTLGCIASTSNASLIEKTVEKFSMYFNNPSSVKLIQYFDPTGEESEIVFCLMDISAQNSFGGTTTATYLVVINRSNGKFSAFSFDEVVTHFDELRYKNEVFAIILSLEHGSGSFVVNQLNMDCETCAVLLRFIYNQYYE